MLSGIYSRIIANALKRWKACALNLIGGIKGIVPRSITDAELAQSKVTPGTHAG